MMAIGIAEYQRAVIQLITLARTSTSGGRAAAQVLLSAYNGSEFQLDVTDLCCISREYYEASLNVIRGRVELRTEPHTLIENGNIIFSDLWEKWSRYSLENRWKEWCPECYGHGNEYNDNGDKIGQCSTCGGSGLVER